MFDVIAQCQQKMVIPVMVGAGLLFAGAVLLFAFGVDFGFSFGFGGVGHRSRFGYFGHGHVGCLAPSCADCECWYGPRCIGFKAKRVNCFGGRAILRR